MTGMYIEKQTRICSKKGSEIDLSDCNNFRPMGRSARAATAPGSTLAPDTPTTPFELIIEGVGNRRFHLNFPVQWFKDGVKPSLSELSSLKINKPEKEIEKSLKSVLDLIDVKNQLPMKTLGFSLKRIKQAVNEWLRAHEELFNLDNKICNNETECKKKRAPFQLDGKKLVKYICDKRKWIQTSIQDFNRHTPTPEKLHMFLSECEKVFETTSELLSNQVILELLGEPEKKVYHLEADKYRLTLPIHALIDTGINIAVLGEAGAGKTTALRMYARKELQRNKNSLIIYVPLVRLYGGDTFGCKDFHEASYLVFAICRYLKSLDVHISHRELEDRIKSERVVLLLDGIDEVAESSKQILEDVHRLSESTSYSQIIISSRLAGSYVEKIPFITVTLLPFTEHQRDSFIKDWFENVDKKHVPRIARHFTQHKEVASLVCTPLLTTILCVLEKNGAPLPDSELRLYDERMRLLLGHYDLYKKVSRLKTQTYYLQKLSEQIAYYLHVNQKTFEKEQVLEKHSIRVKPNGVSDQKVIAAFRELNDPCNILVPMTEDGQIGFGHLRYQEYLAAKVIYNDRSIDLRRFFRQDWWRDAMILFAKMNRSLKWIFKLLEQEGYNAEAFKTLKAMVAGRSQKERKDFDTLLQWKLQEKRIEPSKIQDLIEAFDEEDSLLLLGIFPENLDDAR